MLHPEDILLQAHPAPLHFAAADRKEPPRRSGKQRARVREVLLAEHFAPQLAGAWLELYWPEDGTWYRVQCVSVNMQQQTAIIAYETGEVPVHAGVGCIAACVVNKCMWR
jgi:hypothetical protein